MDDTFRLLVLAPYNEFRLCFDGEVVPSLSRSGDLEALGLRGGREGLTVLIALMSGLHDTFRGDKLFLFVTAK